MASEFKKHRFVYAVVNLIGMIVGAGMFGIPYAMAKAGMLVGVFYLLFLGWVILIIHFYYGEIILRTNQPHRLVGYAAKYLGQRAKKIVTFTILLEYYGALLAYIILGSHFLSIIFSRWFAVPEAFWAILFSVVASSIIFLGLKAVSRNEFFLKTLLFLILFFLLVKSASLVNFSNWATFDLKNLFLPYGIILFSLGGSAAIPEMRKILQGDEKRLKKAIVWGTAAPVVLYLLFALVIVGVTGGETSPDAISGLVSHFGEWVVMLGAIVGLLAVFTPFLLLALALKEMFCGDYRMKKRAGFILACLVPLLAYLAGFKNFILVIGFLGAVAGGLHGMTVLWVHAKAKKMGDRTPEFRVKAPKLLAWFLATVFVLGIIYEVFYLVK